MKKKTTKNKKKRTIIKSTENVDFFEFENGKCESKQVNRHVRAIYTTYIYMN